MTDLERLIKAHTEATTLTTIDLRSDLLLLKWMVGINTALLIGVFWQMFTIMGRLP